MNGQSKLLHKRNLLITKHLAERCENAANDVKDWCQLRIQHHEEVLATDLFGFDNWHLQRNDIAQLGSFHLEKRVILKERQRRECADLDELLHLAVIGRPRTVGVGYA